MLHVVEPEGSILEICLKISLPFYPGNTRYNLILGIVLDNEEKLQKNWVAEKMQEIVPNSHF